MSEQWAFQVSPKLSDGTLINLRGDNPEQFQQVLAWAQEHAGDIIATVAAFQAVNAVAPLAGNTSSVSVQQEAPTPQNNGGWTATPPQQQTQQGAAPTCRHGQRVFKSGTSKAGKEYKLWACPSQNRQDQCEAVWIR